MAMDFWAAQRKARAWTTLYVIIFILLTFGVALIAELAMRFFTQNGYDPSIPYIGLAFLASTFTVALYEYGMFRSFGGRYVAESVGAQEVNPNTSNPKERQLLNIVQEMAVATSLPMPAVYILDANEINAFAAGLKPDRSAIAVTRGTLNLLTRDELQGVIAHEFGHIYNGDMVISLRLAAMVMGFFFALYLGMRFLQFSSYESGEDRRGGNPVILAAIIFLVAGIFTWFAGSILKSMVSRQREYLADASAVQFTRNPDGIANALRKIAREHHHDMPSAGMAFSHMYFEDASVFSFLFATHPPIWKRIAAIEGREYLLDERKRQI